MARRRAKLVGAVALAAALVPTIAGCSSNSGTQEAPTSTASDNADAAIVSVKSHAFVDIDGAKTDAIIVEYDGSIDADSVSADDYQITDYATYSIEQKGDTALERGDVATAGTVTKAYVNDEAALSDGSAESGTYVVLEVDTDYMLAGNTPAYTATTMVGVTQTGEVESGDVTVAASTEEKTNYTITERENTKPSGETEMKTFIEADPSSIIIPELTDNANWKIGEKFAATNCYSEYTGETSDFDLIYSIYVPDLTDDDKGNVAVALHILDAGSLGEDPMLTLTESQAPVDWASDAVQSKQKTIVICPQVTEQQRSSNDYVATSEVNTALWELLDSIIDEYGDYVNTDRIYGTGQSMGGMTLMAMAAQRDNFFAGFMIAGSQWSNCYNKDLINDGAARDPENDPNTFVGDYANDPNYLNWYYQVSDDNILIMNCQGDQMSHGLWEYTAEYFEAAGAPIAQSTWNPSEPVADQNAAVEDLVSQDCAVNIRWGTFEGGDHMSTWKYSYDITAGFDWLLSQTRSSEIERGKVEALNNEWLGRNAEGEVIANSGTRNFNSALFGMNGPDEVYSEGWTPESVESYLAEHPDAGNSKGGVK